jgi:hypothetical protein
LWKDRHGKRIYYWELFLVSPFAPFELHCDHQDISPSRLTKI